MEILSPALKHTQSLGHKLSKAKARTLPLKACSWELVGVVTEF